jgi:hypothetical protein
MVVHDATEEAHHVALAVVRDDLQPEPVIREAEAADRSA